MPSGASERFTVTCIPRRVTTDGFNVRLALDWAWLVRKCAVGEGSAGETPWLVVGLTAFGLAGKLIE